MQHRLHPGDSAIVSTFYTPSGEKSTPIRRELTRPGRWRTLSRMNRPRENIALLLGISLWGLVFGGCVTAHEATTRVDIFDNTTRKKIEDCILLTIRMESSESHGHWWVAQEEKAGHMFPTQARVRTFSTGDEIDQKGKVMVTIGPYVKGHTLGVEYWLFRPGYQPDDFLSDHVERAYENKTPLDIDLLPEDAGSSLSDEKVLDGARRVLEVQNFLEPCNPDVTRLLTLLIEQVQHVQDNAYKPKWQKQSKEMLPKLREALQRFPRVEVTWRHLPERPAEAPRPVATATTRPAPPVAEAPTKPPARPVVKEHRGEEEKAAASSDLPVTMTPAKEPEEPPISPKLVPVDLSDLEEDSPSSETQPAGNGDKTVKHELKPIHKDQ